MSNNNLDSVETTLQQLKDIVEKNHSSNGSETGLIVQQMERLVVEMKSKTKSKRSIAFPEPPSLTISGQISAPAVSVVY